MPHKTSDFKDPRGDASSISAAPLRRHPASSDSLSGKGRVIEFRKRVNPTSPEPPEPSPDSSCSRPTMHRIADHYDNILAAARRGQHYRSIAAQYGINALEVWKIVTAALQTRKAA